VTYGGETKRVNFDTERRNVLLLELSSQVTLDESGLGENQELADIISSLLLLAHSRRNWSNSAFRLSSGPSSPAAAGGHHPNPSKE